MARGHAWQGACMAGGSMRGRGSVRGRRDGLQRAVRILLECILVN